MAAPTGFAPAVPGLLLLTASTGAIDAVSYLALDRVFTGNMTGNVLFLGFAAVGIGGIPLLNNLIALLGFVLGSIAGGRIIGHAPAGSATPGRLSRPGAVTLLVGAGVLAGLAVFWFALGSLPEPALLLVTLLLAVVMGGQVAAVKPVGNSDITTIVVTNTVANLARESRLGGGTGKNWLPRLLAVLAMGFGALLGAGAVQWWGGAAALLVALAVYLGGAVALIAVSRARPAGPAST